MMQLRAYNEEDHATIASWWQRHGAGVVPHSALPQTGCIAYNYEDTPCAAAWLYMDNSVPFGLLAWPIVNPDVGAIDKFKGLNYCVDWLTVHGKNLGYSSIAAMSAVHSMSRLIEGHDYKIMAKGVEVLMKG